MLLMCSWRSTKRQFTNALIYRTLQYVKKKLSSSEFLITCLSGLKIFKTKNMKTLICLIQKSEDLMPQDYQQTSNLLKNMLGHLKLVQIADNKGVFQYNGLLSEDEKSEICDRVTKYAIIFIELLNDNSLCSEFLTFKIW